MLLFTNITIQTLLTFTKVCTCQLIDYDDICSHHLPENTATHTPGGKIYPVDMQSTHFRASLDSSATKSILPFSLGGGHCFLHHSMYIKQDIWQCHMTFEHL
jgi:hypothetical protein